MSCVQEDFRPRGCEKRLGAGHAEVCKAFIAGFDSAVVSDEQTVSNLRSPAHAASIAPACRPLLRPSHDDLSVDQTPFDSARQPEPAALVQDEPGCYHFRVLDPRVFAILSATMNVITIGHCYHI